MQRGRTGILSHILRWVRTMCIVCAFLAAIAFADSWHTYRRVTDVPGPEKCVVTVSLYVEGVETASREIQEYSQKEYVLGMIAQLEYNGLFVPPAEREGAYYIVQVTDFPEKNYGAWLLIGENGEYYDVLGSSASNPFQLRYGHSKDLFLEISHFLSANGIEDAEG